MSAALKFKQAQVPRQQSEQARLKVIRGPDSGCVYVLQGARATIGRGEENDIVLTDLKTSRRHAELVLSRGGWTVQDLGSANGIACNGKASRQAALKSKDTLALGETLFEFLTQEAPTVMLAAPAPSEQQIRSEQDGLAAQRAKVIAMSQFGGLAKNRPKIEGLPPERARAAAPGANQAASPRSLLLVAAVIGLGYYMMIGPSAPIQKVMRKNGGVSDAGEEELLPPDVPDAVTPQLEKAADVFYKSGFREYREGNYLRARTQFETVLQMDPNHALAKLYLENANQAIDHEVRTNLERGRKSFEAGQLQAARGHFEYVMRLLYRDQNNPAYNEAKDQLGRVVKEMEDTD